MKRLLVIENETEFITVLERDDTVTPRLSKNAVLIFENDMSTVRLQDYNFVLGEDVTAERMIQKLAEKAGINISFT